MANMKTRNAIQLARIQSALDRVVGLSEERFFTSYEFASWASFSRPTAYRYLEKLYTLGLADIQLFQKGKLTCKKYRLTNEAIEILLPKEIF